jgi:hypothetical protein
MTEIRCWIKSKLKRDKPETESESISGVRSILDSIDYIKNASEPDWPEWKKEIWLNCLYAALPRAAEGDRLYDKYEAGR